MNFNDFLSIRRKILNRDNVGSLMFSFVYTVAIVLFIKYLTGSFSQILLIGSSYLELLKIFFIPSILLLFMFLFYLSILISRDELDFHKYCSKLFELKNEDITARSLKTIFDYQGVANTSFNNEKCLHINFSSEGLISKKCFKNYLFEFKTKLLAHGFGIILQAKDLENYFMLRINIDETGQLHITPHMRKYGIWEIQNIKSEIENKTKINLECIYKFIVTCLGRNISLIIKDNRKHIKTFEYIIPTHFSLLPSTDKDDEIPRGIVAKLELPINGRFGFRAWGPDEHAVIYEIRISKTKNL